MGCTINKGGKISPVTPKFTEDSPLRSKDTNSASPLRTKESAIIVNAVKDFKISQTDLIGEKSGKISADYSLQYPAIGKGAFGEVRRAVHRKTNLVRAVKIIYKDSTSKEEQERVINEVNILKNLDHPNIIKIFEFYQDEKQLYIVSELYSGGELFDKIAEMKYFSEKLAAITIKQILSAVFYCHQNKIVHRDLKPENILYETKKEDSILKVVDFGTSRQYDPNERMNQKFGTPYYIAPEVLRKKYNEKCDIWSCGVILYILLCGYPPFNGTNDKAIMDKVAAGQYNFDSEEWVSVSEDAKRFIRKLLEYDPTKRLSAEQALSDPWLKKMVVTQEVDKPIAMNALKNLKTFRAERKLQEATWVYLVNYFATKEEKKDLLKTFQALDTNGDGQLTKKSLLIQEDLNSETVEQDVENIMRVIDYNQSGAIDYSEFVIATINRQSILSKERLEAAFKMFDKDGNGFLTIDELKEAFGQKGVHEDVWMEILKEVDSNSDGKLSYVEFKEMMIKLLQ